MCRALAVVSVLALAAACGRETDDPVPGRVTFNEHVAPIVFEKCASCHRPGEVAPFSLLTYDDARSHATEIARVTAARQMPPWLPEGGEFPIVGDRRLSDIQIETLQRWAKQGTAEGDAARRPAPPVFPGGWQMGTPDLIVTANVPYVLKPQTADVYRNLVLRPSVTTTRYIRAVEFKTNGAPIHHAVVRVDRTSSSRRKDGLDGAAGFEGMSWNALDPDGQFIGWAPGRGPIRSPDGMAWRLDPGTDLIVEVHVIPGAADAQISPTIGLYFAQAPPTRRPVTVKLASKTIDIPAGQSDYLVTDSYVMPVPTQLLSVYPHAHYLARDMLVTATFPDGSGKTLLHIPRWSFHWQQDYRFVAPISLPVGTRLTMKYTFDNSSSNEFNPSTPPTRVRAGPKSTDEMAELGLQLLPESPVDAARLDIEFADRHAQANIAMGEQRVAADPNDAEGRAFLGGSYVQVERFAEALPHLEAAVRLGDRSAATQADLGAVMMSTGKPARALIHFQRAATLAANDEVMHFNLGTTFAALSRTAEAEAAFLKALALNPDYADPYVNLGVLELGRRRYATAVQHFERAATLRPDSAMMHSNLAGAYAAAGRLQDSMASVRRALAIDPNYGPAQATLRRLEAMGVR